MLRYLLKVQPSKEGSSASHCEAVVLERKESLQSPSSPEALMTGTVFAGMAGLLCASAAMAGPFGFDLEDSRKPSKAYSFCEETDRGKFFNYGCTTAPKAHPDMEYYRVSFVEGVGVCGVKGMGKDIPDNPRGYYTRSNTDKIANQIKSKYGPWSEADDYLLYNSIGDESEYWMMSVKQENRHYYYMWDLKNRSINGIDEIYVAAKATGMNTGYVIVEFLTPLEDICDQAINKIGSDVF